MKYLVLGSQGQIGGHLVEYLRKRDHHVIEYDLKRSDCEDLRLFEPNRELKRQLLEYNISQADFVFFLAWDVGGSKYLLNAERSYEFVNNNVAIMSSTFPLLKEYGKPFIFTSSQMADMAHSTYGSTKIVGEKYTEMLGGIYVRLWNVYGFERVNKKSHVITDFIQMALDDGVIKMRTDGSEHRQFLYADDCCEALYVLSKMYDDVPRNEQLHISNYEWSTIEDVAKVVASLIGCEYVKGKLKDDIQKDMQGDPNENMLKYWKPKVLLKDGVECIIKKAKNFQV